MQSRYLAFTLSHDLETRTWCAEGYDARGELFGVGAGATPLAAQAALRAYVLESLLGAAADGEDLTGDLAESPPDGEQLAFSSQELLPIYLRMQRARQHLRQADVAAKLGMTQQAYQKLETPGANPTLSTILRLEQALGVPLLRLA
jgi:DNA-binding XRE family transcriptional regulator